MTDYFIAPDTGSDGGDGSQSDPWTDTAGAALDRALSLITPGASGDVIWCKTGAAFADTAVDIGQYQTPSSTAPLVIRGWDGTGTGDPVGAIAEFDCGGTTGLTDGGADWDNVTFLDLQIHNSGADETLRVASACNIYNCEIYDGTAQLVYVNGPSTRVIGCYIHDGDTGIFVNQRECTVHRNIVGDFESPGTEMTKGINSSTGVQSNTITQNIVMFDPASPNAAVGIQYNEDHGWICNNSVYHNNAGTGSGILISGLDAVVMNNLVEGFSGTGGIGIDYDDSNALIYGANAVFDCETEFANLDGANQVSLADDETLSASPFNISGTITPADFIPADTGNVKQGSIPHTISGTP